MKRDTPSVFGRVMRAAMVASLTLCGITPAAAEYPDKPVRLIVPFAPGGVADLAARLVSQGLSLKWRQQVVVENRPGAGGLLGVDAVIRADPDGPKRARLKKGTAPDE
ncbi:MAG: hypothetical protein QOF91_2378 [Alphaproteobacteria bacterium]|jgi:tripartite-type tricarboxylate transporter receptor subunit TctC|nr:hypothetical protein [Alphaproteobacteria bacterium]